ncbi:hypothetical protein, partial [Pseudomonas sp. 1]|uniref:hypothetical protein n=1 Tax=Pseudomonas sp. 1 TaxID=488747 RepID=UPI00209B59B9
IRFVHVDGAQALMAEIDIEHVPTVSPGAYRYGLPDQTSRSYGRRLHWRSCRSLGLALAS